jgi:Holliday junction resolvase RusA-like endonuclease
MTEQFTICIPLPKRVLSPNYRPASRGGMFGVYAARKKQKERTIEAIEQFFLEGLPWGKVEVQVTQYHKTKRRRDTDNAIGALKSMYDGIVLAGVVKDDTPEYMERKEPVFTVDKQNPRVEITIRRI